MSKNVTGPQYPLGASAAERHAAEMNYRDAWFRTEAMSRDKLLALVASLPGDLSLQRVIAERACRLQDVELVNAALAHVDPDDRYSEEWGEVFKSARGG